MATNLTLLKVAFKSLWPYFLQVEGRQDVKRKTVFWCTYENFVHFEHYIHCSEYDVSEIQVLALIIYF